MSAAATATASTDCAAVETVAEKLKAELRINGDGPHDMTAAEADPLRGDRPDTADTTSSPNCGGGVDVNCASADDPAGASCCDGRQRQLPEPPPAAAAAGSPPASSSPLPPSRPPAAPAPVVEDGVAYVVYESELQMPDIMRLIQKDLSEPYSVYTYRYFIHNWPHLCLMVGNSKTH